MHLKKDLLLLHGALGASSQFGRLIKTLSPSFEIYTFDFIGHGNRSHEDQSFSIPLFASQLSEFMYDHGLDGCDILGYSMGGYVALYAASEDERLAGKIMTLGTKFAWNPESSAKEASMLDPERILEKIPAYAEHLQRLHGSHWKEVLQRTSTMMVELGNAPALSNERLQNIKARVLCAVGDSDKMVSVEETRLASSVIKNSGFAVLPYVTHPLEQVPAGLISSVLQYFLDRD